MACGIIGTYYYLVSFQTGSFGGIRHPTKLWILLTYNKQGEMNPQSHSNKMNLYQK
jgi:hypothetical protein|tara:strand:+ start:96 stop:263 length:168 start_codon:yes stop_codon:yes gene_type:complete